MTSIQAGAARRHTIPPSIEGQVSLSLIERPGDGAPVSDVQVLLLHSYGMPGGETFDVPGVSLMRHLAVTGRPSWALDLPGYGRSGRPAAMARPPRQNPPVGRAADVLGDLERAVAYIRERRAGARIDLLGWSWGGVVAGMWAATRPSALRRLVLIATQYGYDAPALAPRFAPGGGRDGDVSLPAWEVVSAETPLAQWEAMLRGAKLPEDSLLEPGVRRRVGHTLRACDPEPPAPGTFRRPTGPKLDLFQTFTSRPLYDATKIDVPTLIIRGGGDDHADPGLVQRFAPGCPRREVVIGDATHYLLFERVRAQAYDELDAFLAAPDHLRTET